MADVNPITTTTLSIAIPATGGYSPVLGSTSGTIVTPASMTNILAPGPNKSNRTLLWIDREALEVTGITTTTATCTRGVMGTLKAPHNAGTIIWVGTEQDFSFFNQNQTNGGLGIYSTFVVNNETINPTANTVSATLTANQLIGGLIVGTPTGAVNYTLPTATLLIAAMQVYCNPYINQSFEFTILNTSAGANTITVLTGTGVTLTGGTVTIAQNAARKFKVVITNVVAPAVTVYQAS
jgi:hypothetical protein